MVTSLAPAVADGRIVSRFAHFPVALQPGCVRRKSSWSPRARPQEGKTTTSINFAIVLAQKGVRVLLVDADLRRPSVHKTLGMGPRSWP